MLPSCVLLKDAPFYLVITKLFYFEAQLTRHKGTTLLDFVLVESAVESL